MEPINNQNNNQNETKKHLTDLACKLALVQHDIENLTKVRNQIMEEFSSTIKSLNPAPDTDANNDDNNNKL